MILLTVDEIISLHSKLISKTGGVDGLRDKGLLESAVYSDDSGFGDEEAYPTVEEKSARLMCSFVSNHAFVDGNKRIGVFVLLLTLRLNGIILKYRQAELVALGLSTAKGEPGCKEIPNWINNHKE